MTEREARAAAQREFGNTTLQQEESRSTWIARWVTDLLQDLTYATRTIRKEPGFAAAASLSMERGRVVDARIVMGHVAPVPWLSQEAATALIGRAVDHSAAEAAGAAAVAEARPLSGNAYKVDLARVAVKRAILLAAGFETGGF